MFGCKGRGRPSDGPLDHRTGKGWVKETAGQYADALNKRTKVHLLLVERTGGVGRGTRAAVRQLSKRAEGKGAIDRTKYGLSRMSTRSYYTHHVQQLGKEAIVGDVKQIATAVTNLKRKVFVGSGADASEA